MAETIKLSDRKYIKGLLSPVFDDHVERMVVAAKQAEGSGCSVLDFSMELMEHHAALSVGCWFGSSPVRSLTRDEMREITLQVTEAIRRICYQAAVELCGYEE